MQHVRSFCGTWLALMALLCVSFAFGQSDLGSISGFIKDPSSASVPGAKVTVANQATGAERQAVTNESGSFCTASQKALAPG